MEDARQKLRDIVLVAYESLDPALKRELPITRSNTGELAVNFVRHEEAKSNAMFAGTHARGGANSFLWISEWGVVQSTDLASSEEILTGALPSVGDGLCVMRRHGGADATGICGVWSSPRWKPRRIRKGRWTGGWSSSRGRTSQPIAMRCRGRLARRHRRYFADKPRHQPGAAIVVSTQAGRTGDVHAARISDDHRGVFSIAGRRRDLCRDGRQAKGRGGHRSWKLDHSALTHTCWDLGSPINTAVWYFQLGPMGEIRVIDCDLDSTSHRSNEWPECWPKATSTVPLPAARRAGHAEERPNVPERTQGGGSGQLQGGPSNDTTSGSASIAQADAAALQLPAATL